jgi:membrane protease YdiL (CAAX protease family)
VIQALMFSAFHQYDIFNSLRVFLFGIAFAVIYEKRKNIIAPISAHVFVNGIAMLPLFLTTALNIHPGF